MARPVIPAAILADRGVPVPLLDGRTVQVCYNFASLLLLEERYGSVQAAVAKVSEGAEGATFTTVAGILGAGLRHEVDADGRALSDPHALADLLDPMRIAEYATAIGEAFSRSFPAAPAAEGSADPTTPTAPSPGETGTTSPSSASDSPLTSSGA